MTIDIDAIRQREQAATKGPWEAAVDDHGRGQVDASVWSDELSYYIAERISSAPNHVADAEFIAHARTDVPALLAKVDELTAERDEYAADNTRVVAQLVAANRHADGLKVDLRSANTANTAWANQTGEKPDGPWKALIVHEGWVADDFSELAPDDEVDIVIVRDSSLPDDEGHMPGTYKSGDVAYEATDIYVDGDGGTDGPTVFARAQAMAAGLNAVKEVTR